ncbi:MAG: hypothetical protein DSM106950_33515 [Stigonema ocellatum SAG 48.90 = DSM 106950]|nr:hypothetical protein [Stigonema ocellatum SAG 48.90 = DSM 106950]
MGQISASFWATFTHPEDRSENTRPTTGAIVNENKTLRQEFFKEFVIGVSLFKKGTGNKDVFTS